MPQKIDSQRLSQLAGQAVEITVKDGETLEQAEERVMQEHPDLFGKEQVDFGTDMSGQQSQSINLPQEVLAIKEYAGGLPLGSKEQKEALKMYEAARDDYLKLNPAPKTKSDTGFTSSDIEDLATMKEAKSNLMDLLEFKNSAFGGKGINTGPIIGGRFPLPFTDNEPNLYPSSVSEFVNKIAGEKENSGDRGEFRRRILSFLNPTRKEVTGAGAATNEITTYIAPTAPQESDDDTTFFKKGLSTLPEIQRRIIKRLETAKQAGRDVSGFQDELNTSPDAVVDQLLETLTKNPNGSFAKEFPEKTKSFLERKLKQQSTSSQPLKATHRFNPQTGMVEAVQ